MLRGETYTYELLEFLGEGGSGRVYKAFRYSLYGKNKEVVALKFLKTKKSVQELIKEYSVLQTIRSKYAVHVYGVEKINKEAALVMEYIEGVTWKHLFSLPLSPDLKSYLLDVLRRALVDIGEQNSFHGDISPSNILIDKNARLRLIDFGNHFADNRHYLATPNFVSEDVIQGEHHGLRSDLQSLKKVQDYYKILEVPYVEKSAKKQIVVIVKANLSGITKVVYQRATRRIGLQLVTFFGLLLLFVPIEARSPKLQVTSGEIGVTITSQSWKRIYINGKDMGYTPVNTTIRANKVLIQWSDAKSSGTIRRKPTKNQVHLSDKDFSAH